MLFVPQRVNMWQAQSVQRVKNHPNGLCHRSGHSSREGSRGVRSRVTSLPMMPIIDAPPLR